MPRGPKGEKRPADVISNAVLVMKIATGEAEDRVAEKMRRFTRLTNAFSKKFENHMHVVALYTVWYNFVKQHKTLEGLSPAMASGISDTLWSMTDLAELVDAAAPKPGKRGTKTMSAQRSL